MQTGPKTKQIGRELTGHYTEREPEVECQCKRPEAIILNKVAETHKSMPDEMTCDVDLGPEGNEINMYRK